MQAVPNSVISLNYSATDEQGISKIASYSFSGGRRCTLSNVTFDELLAQRVGSKLPCVIARVKDIEGTIHLFEGCAADALESFRLPGYFKASLDGKWQACLYIQYYTLVGTAVANQHLFHNFSLAHANAYHTLHAQLCLSSKKPDFAFAKKCLDKAIEKNPNDERALELLGKLYFYGQGVPQDKERAKKYFDTAILINPDNKFVINRLAELANPAALVEPESAALVDEATSGLNALSLEESSGTESEAEQEPSEVLEDVTSKSVEARSDEPVAAEATKKPACSCTLL